MKKNLIIALLGVFCALFIIYSMLQRNIAFQKEAENYEFRIKALELEKAYLQCQTEAEQQKQRTLNAERIAIEMVNDLRLKEAAKKN